MTVLTIETLQKIARGKINVANATSVVVGFNKYGPALGVDQPHRLVQYLAQIMHEGGEFKHDREVWGPTPAQKRYDTRTDLGNTSAIDGDGKLYAGRTAIQITGRSNYGQFRDWCKAKGWSPPDFVKSPDLVNTDPWEGVGPLWYWDTRNLNRWADQGDVETITKKVNGGLNGYADRVELLVRASLVLLGYGPTEVRRFQTDQNLALKDNDPGPKTRSALHLALVALTSKRAQSVNVAAAPVVEETEVEVPVAVAPAAIDKPVTQTSGFWERISLGSGLLTTIGATIAGVDWRAIIAISVVLIVVVSLGLWQHERLIATVRRIKLEVAS